MSGIHRFFGKDKPHDMTSFPSENMKKSDKTGINGNQLEMATKGLYRQSKITRHVKNFLFFQPRLLKRREARKIRTSQFLSLKR